MVFVRLLLVAFFFPSIAISQISELPVFRGEITFEKYVILDAEDMSSIPDYLYEVESINTITYYLLSDSVVYTKVVGTDGRIERYTKKSPTAEKVFSLETMSIRNLVNGDDILSDLKEKFSKTKEKTEVGDFECMKYLYSTNKNDKGFFYVALNFPFKISLQDELIEVSLPIHKQLIKVKSEIRSKVTESLNWTRHSELVGFVYDPSINIDYIIKLFD